MKIYGFSLRSGRKTEKTVKKVTEKSYFSFRILSCPLSPVATTSRRMISLRSAIIIWWFSNCCRNSSIWRYWGRVVGTSHAEHAFHITNQTEPQAYRNRTTETNWNGFDIAWVLPIWFSVLSSRKAGEFDFEYWPVSNSAW